MYKQQQAATALNESTTTNKTNGTDVREQQGGRGRKTERNMEGERRINEYETIDTTHQKPPPSPLPLPSALYQCEGREA